MMQVKEVREWLDSLQPHDEIGIDEGGLCLVVRSSQFYLEIGGLPDDDEPEPGLGFDSPEDPRRDDHPCCVCSALGVLP